MTIPILLNPNPQLPSCRPFGNAALSLVQKAGLDIPFLVVSGAIGEEAAVAMMKAGAHDYSDCQKSFPDSADGSRFGGVINKALQSEAKPITKLLGALGHEIIKPVCFKPQPQALDGVEIRRVG